MEILDFENEEKEKSSVRKYLLLFESIENASYVIRYWLKNLNTLELLEEWEIVHTPNFKKNQSLF